MKLLTVKPLKYVSPSTFLSWKSCQLKPWLEKCSGYRYDTDYASPSAALGTVFDIIVKLWWAGNNGQELDSKELWENLEISADNKEVLADGITLAHKYIALNPGLFNDLVKVNINSDIEYKGIPLFGYPDGLLKGGVAFDWKTRGYKATYNSSPKAGYRASWDLDTKQPYKRSHKRFGEPLDHLFEDWATQLLFYFWMEGDETATPYGCIHEVILSQKRTIVAEHYGTFSDEFINQTYKDLSLMWEKFNNEYYEIEEPIPSPSICHKWGRVCRAAIYCSAYKKWQEFENDEKVSESQPFSIFGEA